MCNTKNNSEIMNKLFRNINDYKNSPSGTPVNSSDCPGRISFSIPQITSSACTTVVASSQVRPKVSSII